MPMHGARRAEQSEVEPGGFETLFEAPCAHMHGGREKSKVLGAVIASAE